MESESSARVCSGLPRKWTVHTIYDESVLRCNPTVTQPCRRSHTVAVTSQLSWISRRISHLVSLKGPTLFMQMESDLPTFTEKESMRRMRESS